MCLDSLGVAYFESLSVEATRKPLQNFNNKDDNNNNNKRTKQKITVTNGNIVKIKYIDFFKVKLVHIDDFPRPSPYFCVPANSS